MAKLSDDPLFFITEKILEKQSNLPKEKHSELVRFLKKTLSNVSQSNLENLCKQQQKDMTVCSFSEINDSILMWGHYANNHKGFCIEYDFESEILYGDVRGRSLFPVIYSEDIFDASKYLCEAITNKQGFSNLFGILAAIHKAPEWSYEKEWRLVYSIGRSFNEKNYEMTKVKNIFLGAKISPTDENTLLKIAKNKGLNVYKMVLERDRFKLIAQLLENF